MSLAANTQGFLSAAKGRQASDNPYKEGTTDHRSWLLGWAEWYQESKEILSDHQVQDYLRAKGRI